MENAGARTKGSSGRRRILLFLALLAVVASFFLGLSAFPLFDEDEPRFAEAARVMAETGDYITPTFNGNVRLAKPILIYWLMVGSYRVFGVNELGARFPSAAATALTAMAIVWLVSHVVRGRAAWLAAIAWGSFLQTAVWARAAATDATLTLFMTASYLALYLGFQGEGQRKRAWYLLAGGAMGFGFITKGPIAVALPLAVGVVYLLSVRRLKAELLQARIWEPLLIFLVIATPWYYLAYRHHGSEFLRAFFVGENVERYAAEGRGGIGRFFYFVPFALFMTFPFSALLPALVKAGWRPEPETSLEDTHSFPRYLLCWFAFVVVLFSFSGVKNPQYIMSAYPALAIFAGIYFDRLLRGQQRLEWPEKVAVVLTIAMGAILATAAGLLPRLLPAYAAKQYGTPSAQVPLIAASLAVVAGGGTLAAGCFWLLARRRAALGAMVFTPWLLGLLAVLWFGPELASYRQVPLRALCGTAQKLVPEDAMLALFGFRSSSAVFYSHRHVGEAPLDRTQGLGGRLARGERVGIIAPQREVERLAPLGPLREWDRQGGYVLLGRDPEHRGEGRSREESRGRPNPPPVPASAAPYGGPTTPRAASQSTRPGLRRPPRQ